MLSNLQTAPKPLEAASPAPRASVIRERNDRLRAMKGLVVQLVHAFNNSLAPMAGYVTLLGEEIKLSAPGEQYLTKFEGALGKAQGLMEALVQATHPERQFLPKRTDLGSLVQRTVEAWMKALPPTAQIAVESKVIPCTLWLDDAQWTQLIRHLLRNAEVACEDGGSVRLSLEAQMLTPAAAKELELSDGAVYQLVIEDSGCGMSPEVLQRACDPLFSTRPQAPMAGLGLTFAHSVVQLHGGQLDLQSSEELGTTIRIWLPAKSA